MALLQNDNFETSELNSCSVKLSSNSWGNSIVQRQNLNGCTTLGLASGNLENCDVRCVLSLAAQLTEAAASRQFDARLLVVRLDVYPSKELDRLLDQPNRIPNHVRSPMGNWKEVMIPMPVGERASWSLLQIPSWITAWRKEFDFILIDLGPIHRVPARIVGHLCSETFILLGPRASGSKKWLSRHINWLTASGVKVSGSLVASLERHQAAA